MLTILCSLFSVCICIDPPRGPHRITATAPSRPEGCAPFLQNRYINFGVIALTGKGRGEHCRVDLDAD
jgi:hypothetical protein